MSSQPGADSLTELTRRYHLLEADRRAFYETSQFTLNQNKESINTLKDQVKHLRQDLLQLQKARGTADSASAALEREIKEAEIATHKQRSKRDLLQHEIHRKESVLDQLQDQLNDLQNEINGALPSADDPNQRRIRDLEASLDKVTIKFNEAQGIKNTYEQIVKRLTEERMGYQNDIKELETLIKQKEEEIAEVELILSDAKQAKNQVQNELEKAKTKFETQREARETALLEKRDALEKRVELYNKLKEKEVRTEGQKSTPSAQKSTPSVNESQAQSFDHVSTSEEAFEKLKEVTGVSSPNEIIEKFNSQQATHDSLTKLISEAEQKIQNLEEERSSLQSKLEGLKFSGAGGNQTSQFQVEEHERKLADAKSKHAEASERHEASFKLLVEVKVALENLVDRCASVKLPNSVSAPLPKGESLNDDNVVSALNDVSNRVVKITEILESEGVSREEIGKGSFLSMVDLSSSSVKIPLTEEDNFISDDDNDDDVVDKVLDRKTLKQRSEELGNDVTGTTSASKAAKV
ncbi:hypothetical protein P9112_007027 [Eukaryota sp. TZLM1-RC]